MAVHIAFFSPYNIGGATSFLPKQPRIAESIASAVTSTQTTATAKRGEFARIEAVDACYVMAGQNPTVTATNGYRIAIGKTEYIGPLSEGDEIAVLDA